jgi:predicted RecB family nuclease
LSYVRSKTYKLSASLFYDFSKCRRRIFLDIHGDETERGKESDFLRLLWERGVLVEKDILDRIQKERPMVVVEGPAGKSTSQETLELMKQGSELIVQGVLAHADWIGRPDILEKVQGESRFGNYHYVPIDVKSGRATEREDGPIKQAYAHQVLFYAELLEHIQERKPRWGGIIDASGERVDFEINDYQEHYEGVREEIKGIVYNKQEVEPVIGGICKQCPWFVSCRTWAEKRRDLSLIFSLGRQKYDLRKRGVKTIQDLARIDISAFQREPLKINGVGKGRLTAWRRRAGVILNDKPLLFKEPKFLRTKQEIYFDIEDDPLRDEVYLYGIIERTPRKPNGQFRYFSVEKGDQEENTARAFWKYLNSLDPDSCIYHYGAYEKTKLSALQRKYDLAIEPLEKFERLRRDLYSTVQQCSDWPLFSYSIKDIAKYLGFRWTAEDASGANSIAWYRDYQNSVEGDRSIFEKIVQYNKEDCQAMIVVKDWFEEQSAKSAGGQR